MRSLAVTTALLVLGACAQLPQQEPDHVKTRKVVASKETRIWAHGRWKRGAAGKCFARRIDVRVVEQPAHGTVRLKTMQRKPARCENRVDHLGIFYTAEAGYRGADSFSYLRVNPDSGRTQLYLIKLEVEPGSEAGAKPRYSPDLVREIQRLLAAQGYQPGPADGQMGPKTRRAIRAFQESQGLKTSGEPSEALLKRLRDGA